MSFNFCTTMVAILAIAFVVGEAFAYGKYDVDEYNEHHGHGHEGHHHGGHEGPYKPHSEHEPPYLRTYKKFVMGECKKDAQWLGKMSYIYSYPVPKNMTIQIKYPEEGQKAAGKIACVVLNLYDSMDQHTAEMVEGGEGKDHFTIAVKAQDTKYLAYDAYVYGYPTY